MFELICPGLPGVPRDRYRFEICAVYGFGTSATPVAACGEAAARFISARRSSLRVDRREW
eukprot:3319711-Prymnesium_polylepis.1